MFCCVFENIFVYVCLLLAVCMVLFGRFVFA